MARKKKEERTPELTLAEHVKLALQGDNQEEIAQLNEAYYGTNDKEICLCIPTYKTVCPVTMVALLATALRYGKERVGVHFEFGDAVIENARNKIADKALADGYEWLMWIDDDIIPPFGRSDLVRRWTGVPPSWQDMGEMEFLSRFLAQGKTVIGGLYFGRNVQGRPMYAEGCMTNGREENIKARDINCMEVNETDWVATGCMLVHRSVYEDIQKKFPEIGPKEISYTDFQGRTVTRKQEVWDYYRKLEGCGEDVSFCFRARESGHKVYVDHSIKCLHAGGNAWGYHNAQGGLE